MIPIYERSKLSKQFIDFIKNEGVPEELLPYWDNNSCYRYDWNIIGGESARMLFDPTGYAFHKFYVIEKNPITEPFPYQCYSTEQQKEVAALVQRLSTKIFEPERMIRSKTITDQVRLRIVVSMLNKIELPKDVSDTIFDNLIITYWVRKRAYDVFFCKEVMQFPFAPDFEL